MGEVGTIQTAAFDLGSLHIVFNPRTIMMTWIVFAAMLIFFIWLSRNLKKVPGRRQALAEVIIEMFDNLVKDTVGSDHRRYFPLIMTIFLFVLFSNWIGVVPGLEEPTKDLNTPMALALIVFIVTNFSGVKYKGIIKYIIRIIKR